MNGPSRQPYLPPPDDWNQPNRCEGCGDVIIWSEQAGRWVHVGREDHEATIGRWWDTDTGDWRDGQPADR